MRYINLRFTYLLTAYVANDLYCRLRRRWSSSPAINRSSSTFCMCMQVHAAPSTLVSLLLLAQQCGIHRLTIYITQLWGQTMQFRCVLKLHLFGLYALQSAQYTVVVGVFFYVFSLFRWTFTYLLTYLLTPMLILHSLCVFKGGSQRQR